MHKIFSQSLTIFLVLLIYAVAFFIQHNIIMNGDISLLMNSTDRFLHGGKYGIDFFETMPPMILYILSIPVIGAHVFSTNFIITNFFFTFSLSLFSLILSDYYIKTLEHSTNALYKRIILLPATAAIILLPQGFEFSESEHLTLMLILPFLFATTLRMKNIELKKPLAILTGLLAGIGFCIKPQFLICFFLVEVLYFENNKKIRPETMAIVLLAIAYGFIILLFHQAYLTLVLPSVLKYYYQGHILVFTIQDLLIYPPFYLSLFSCCIGYFFILLKKEDIFLEKILTLSVASFCIIYLIQQTNWYHHALPALSLSILLLVQICYRCFLSIFLKKNASFYVIFATLLWSITFYFPIKIIFKNITMSSYIGKSTILMLYAHLAHFPKTSQIYFFINSGYPTIDYLPFRNLQFMQNDWFIPGIIAKTLTIKPEILSQNPLIKRFIKDFIDKNPDIVVLDTQLNHYAAFEILRVFSFNKEFNERFQQYVKIGELNYTTIYVKKNLANLDELYHREPAHINEPTRKQS